MIVRAYLLAQYFWPLLMSLLLVMVIPFRVSSTTKDFFSSAPVNSSETTNWYLHVGGLRLSTVRGNYDDVFERMHKAIVMLRPQRIFISGDVTDNACESSMRPHQSMVRGDWELYERLIKELNVSDKVLAVAGRRDVFGISHFYSDTHYAKGIIYNHTTFPVHRTILNEGLSVIQLNPYTFPTPPFDVMSWAFPQRVVLEELVKEIEHRYTHNIVILAHHPVWLWYPNYATTANAALSEVLLRATTVRFYLSGEMEIDTPQFYHHGDVVEVVGTPLDTVNKVGLMTFSGRQGAYHTVDLDQEIVAVIVSPPPASQISGLDVFSETHKYLRVLVFTDAPMQLVARGTGIHDIEADLVCEMIEEGVQECSLPLHLTVGLGDISVREIGGKWKGSVNFVVATIAGGMTQPVYTGEASLAWIYIFVAMAIFSLVLTLPVVFVGVGNAFERWMMDGGDQSRWMFAIFGGFFAVHRYFMEAPLHIRMGLFLSVIWSVFLPSVFFTIENKIAVLMSFGHVCDGISVFGFYGMKCHALYFYVVLIPMMLFISSVWVTQGRMWVFIIDCIVYAASIATWLFGVYTISCVFGVASGLTSPLFFIIPLCLHISIFIWAAQTLQTHHQVSPSYVSLMTEQ